jgi:hypothetical protein
MLSDLYFDLMFGALKLLFIGFPSLDGITSLPIVGGFFSGVINGFSTGWTYLITALGKISFILPVDVFLNVFFATLGFISIMFVVRLVFWLLSFVRPGVGPIDRGPRSFM